MNAAALALTVGLAAVPLTDPAPLKPFRVESRIPLSSVETATRRSFMDVGVYGVAVALAAGFDEDGNPLLRVRARGADDAAYPYPALDKGVRHGAVFIRRHDKALDLCAPAGCQALLLRDLTHRAHWAGVPLDVPHVRYTLTLSPDGRTLSMLRRDADGQYWIASHTLAALRAGPVWYVAVNGIMYGLRLDGAELVLVSKPIPKEPR